MHFLKIRKSLYFFQFATQLDLDLIQVQIFITVTSDKALRMSRLFIHLVNMGHGVQLAVIKTGEWEIVESHKLQHKIIQSDRMGYVHIFITLPSIIHFVLYQTQSVQLEIELIHQKIIVWDIWREENGKTVNHLFVSKL